MVKSHKIEGEYSLQSSNISNVLNIYTIETHIGVQEDSVHFNIVYLEFWKMKQHPSRKEQLNILRHSQTMEYYSLGTKAVILKIWSLKCVSDLNSWSKPKHTAAETLVNQGQLTCGLFFFNINLFILIGG